MKFKLTITHLYPDLMNLYGDLGNIICLKQRCLWRNIEINIQNISLNENIDNVHTDIYFLGGGQDNDQIKVYKDLIKNKKNKLIKDLDNNTVMLAICGGYQLLGKYFLDAYKNKIHGIGFLNIETIAPGKGMSNRAVGNIITKLLPDSKINKHYTNLKHLVGFENHGGRTKFLDNKLKPLGKVLIGEGDNKDKKHEGVIYKNTIGSYMHGSILPKNPHLTDFLIKNALEKKYNTNIKLQKLNDKEEIQAHKYILKKYNIK